MREIKFRAWDKHCTVMCDVRMLTWNMHDLFIQNDGRYHVMQFTGLKDKNGKEIYEGDVVRCINRYNESSIFAVVYSAPFFHYDTPNKWLDSIGAWTDNDGSEGHRQHLRKPRASHPYICSSVPAIIVAVPAK